MLPTIDPVQILVTLIFVGILVFVFAVVGYGLFIIYTNRNREARSIDSVLLQVGLPRGNELKIDVMEQLLSSLYSIKKSGWKQKFDIQPTVSFEIVAKQEDIRFYVWTPKKLMDLVEKSIHGAYPDAEVNEVDEINMFTNDGKVAYKAYQLKKSNFYPIKTFKDLATDPLSAITSDLAKLGPGEAAAIQVVISPAESDWQKEGSKFISDTKKSESDPEKAKYSVSAKTLEAVEQKISKPGFETSIRIVAVSPNEENAKGTVTNIGSAFAQFAGDLNNLKSRKIWRKGSFMEDFLYRYQPMFNIFVTYINLSFNSSITAYP